jgi:hypothetical protein
MCLTCSSPGDSRPPPFVSNGNDQLPNDAPFPGNPTRAILGVSSNECPGSPGGDFREQTPGPVAIAALRHADPTSRAYRAGYLTFRALGFLAWGALWLAAGYTAARGVHALLGYLAGVYP